MKAPRRLQAAGHAAQELRRRGPRAGAGQTGARSRYEERDGVGYLSFDFYNGAMSTDQCRRLREAYRFARAQPTRAIVLMGGRDFFSNGIHLNVIEAADDPATESWLNLHAIDEVVREIVETDSHLVISALEGDAAAGGVPFALAADYVLAREDVVLNPYYQHMGGLYGSEYWTYLMPRRIGHELTEELTSAPFEPIGTRRAVEIGLLDDTFGDDVRAVPGHVPALARDLATGHICRRCSRRSTAPAASTSRSSRSRPTAPRNWRGHTSASSATTAATTRRATASCTSSARRVWSRRRFARRPPGGPLHADPPTPNRVKRNTALRTPRVG